MRLTCEETGEQVEIITRVTSLGAGAEVRANGYSACLERRGCSDPTVHVAFLDPQTGEWIKFLAHECGNALRRGHRIRVIESGVTRTWVFDSGVPPEYMDGPMERAEAGMLPL